MRIRRLTCWVAAALAALLLASCVDQAGCGPGQLCETAERCVWLPVENRGFCAPACGDGGTCPDGLRCAAVAPGECWPCRVYSEACIAP